MTFFRTSQGRLQGVARPYAKTGRYSVSTEDPFAKGLRIALGKSTPELKRRSSSVWFFALVAMALGVGQCELAAFAARRGGLRSPALDLAQGLEGAAEGGGVSGRQFHSSAL